MIDYRAIVDYRLSVEFEGIYQELQFGNTVRTMILKNMDTTAFLNAE